MLATSLNAMPFAIRYIEKGKTGRHGTAPKWRRSIAVVAMMSRRGIMRSKNILNKERHSVYKVCQKQGEGSDNVSRLNKKGFEFITNWVFVFFVAILVLSFLLSIVIVNVWVNYLIMIFAAVILGRFIFTSKYGSRFPYYALSFAFISGYLAGHRAGNGFFLLALFIGVMVLTYKVFKATQ